MATFDYTAANAVLKEDYKDLVEQLSNEVFMLNVIEQNSDPAEGRRALHALHVSRNGGVGARATGAALPTPGTQGYVDAYIPLRKQYAAISIERQLMTLTAQKSGAFVRAVESEMEGAKNDVTVDEGRQVWGTSDGVLAATAASGPSTTVTLASTTTATQLRQISEFIGRGVDIGTVAAPTGVAENRTLVSVDETAKTIVISGAAVTTLTTDRLFFTGNGGASSGTGLQNDGQVEYTGLQTIISDTGSLHGVSPTTYPTWRSVVSANGGTLRNISEALVNNTIQATETRSGGSVELLVSNYGVQNALAADMRAMRRNMDNVDLKGGFSGIAYTSAGHGRKGSNVRALVWDRDCPNNQLFGITPKDLINYKATGWEWIDEDGAVLQRTITSAGRIDSFGAELAKYAEVGTKRRNTHFVIRDLAEA